MNQDITIRDLYLEDAISVAALSVQLGYTASVRETEIRLKAISDNIDHVGYAAVVGDNVVGWIHAFYTFSLESEPFVEIGGLVVASAFRKRGIGKQLISQVATWGKTRKASRLRVRCNTTRKSTHAFYLLAGFTEAKEQKVFDLKILEQGPFV